MKKFLSIILVFTMFTALSTTALAAPGSVAERSLHEPSYQIVAIMVDENTGIRYTIPSKKIKNVIVANQDGQSFTEETTVTFSVPKNGIAPLISDTAISDTDVTSTIKIDYTRVEDKIRVNKVSGSWVPASSLMHIYDREVHYGDGAPSGHVAHKYPTTNSFSYTTGWSYVIWYPASSDAMTGARAYSRAMVEVSGMGTPHSLEVFVTASK